VRQLLNTVMNGFTPLIGSVFVYFALVTCGLSLLAILLLPGCAALDVASGGHEVDRKLLVKSMIYVQRNLLDLMQQSETAEH